jgi:hypothetical protein
MTVRTYSPVLPSIELFGAYEGIASATGVNQTVSLTFTPTSEGNLTIVPYDGDDNISQMQLEAAPTPSSYIPTSGSTATRAAETLTVPAANLPYDNTNLSIQMDGRMTYADEGASLTAKFFEWIKDSNDNVVLRLDTDSGSGAAVFVQEAGGTQDFVQAVSAYSPGINVPFNIASRHGSTFINGAVDGTALTANTTPTAFPDLSATDLTLAPTFNGTISQFIMWGADDGDIGDAGIAEAST